MPNFFNQRKEKRLIVVDYLITKIDFKPTLFYPTVRVYVEYEKKYFWSKSKKEVELRYLKSISYGVAIPLKNEYFTNDEPPLAFETERHAKIWLAAYKINIESKQNAVIERENKYSGLFYPILSQKNYTREL